MTTPATELIRLLTTAEKETTENGNDRGLDVALSAL